MKRYEEIYAAEHYNPQRVGVALFPDLTDMIGIGVYSNLDPANFDVVCDLIKIVFRALWPNVHWVESIKEYYAALRAGERPAWSGEEYLLLEDQVSLTLEFSPRELKRIATPHRLGGDEKLEL